MIIMARMENNNIVNSFLGLIIQIHLDSLQQIN